MAYCRKPFSCFKYGRSCDSKSCKKPWDTPATCVFVIEIAQLTIMAAKYTKT